MIINCMPEDRIPMPPITIVDYFDPRNITHVMAYDELMKTGRWPHGFNDGLDHPSGWQILLMNKLANAWTEHIMETGGLKLKLHQAKLRLMDLEDHRSEVEIAVAVMGEVEHTMLA